MSSNEVCLFAAEEEEIEYPVRYMTYVNVRTPKPVGVGKGCDQKQSWQSNDIPKRHMEGICHTVPTMTLKSRTNTI